MILKEENLIDGVSRLLKANREYDELSDKLQDLSISIDIDFELIDSILDIIGVPEDRTVEDMENGFCRDSFTNRLNDIDVEGEDFRNDVKQVIDEIQDWLTSNGYLSE